MAKKRWRWRARWHSGWTDQSKAAVHREKDARALRQESRWRGAMYLLGYAVECRLKAKLMERHGLWDLEKLQSFLSHRLKREINVFTHSLTDLMDWTAAQHRMNGPTRACWNVVRTWDVSWRYSPSLGSAEECSRFFEACEAVSRYIWSSI